MFFAVSFLSRKNSRWLTVAVVAFVLTAGGAASAQSVQLKGVIAPDAMRLPTYGDLPSGRTLPLEIWFKPRNQAALEKLLAEQQDPASPRFHQWLTPAEYTRRFGITRKQFDRLSQWLVDDGFQVIGGSPAEGVIRFNGSILAIVRAFNTRIGKFTRDGSRFGNLFEPEIPAEFSSIVGNLAGLDNLHSAVAMSHGALRSSLSPAGPRGIITPGTGGTITRGLALQSPVEVASITQDPELIVDNQGPALAPSDFDVFYDATPLRSQGVTGAPGCIAIVGDSGFDLQAVQTFNTRFGLPDTSGSIVQIGNGGEFQDAIEADLDLEWAHAVAPGAGLILFSANDVVTALQNAVNDNSCSVVSISFGLCGGGQTLYTSTIHGLAQQAAAQGQTIVVAAGDTGAAGLMFDPLRGCVPGTSAHVNELASDPLITSIGGTSFNTSAFSGPEDSIVSHTTERVWNDVNDGSLRGGATGGGLSAFFSKPSYQNGVAPVNNRRAQPDVALLASPRFPGSFFYDNENGLTMLGIIGGTSISAPMWAGIVKLLEQKAGARLGAINPRIYQIAGADRSNAGFYDVTSGNNTFDGVSGFSAGPGYDPVTGWGSVDIAKFAAAYTQSGTTNSSASVALSRTFVNFGKKKIGKQKQKKVKLINTAKKKSGTVVTFSGGSISGSSAFSLSTTCNGAVAPRHKCFAYVRFAPTTTGLQTATVTITSNACNGPNHTFTVSGTGK